MWKKSGRLGFSLSFCLSVVLLFNRPKTGITEPCLIELELLDLSWVIAEQWQTRGHLKQHCSDLIPFHLAMPVITGTPKSMK